MDVIKAPTKIERPVYRAEFRYTPAPGTKAREISGFDDTGTRIKIYMERFHMSKQTLYDLSKFFSRRKNVEEFRKILAINRHKLTKNQQLYLNGAPMIT